MQAFCDERGMHAVDLMGGPISALEKASGLEASRDPGLMRTVDQNYFRRIAAMEFTVEHDDGRNPQDLPDADIVLLGVSRSSKTPISIYMGMEAIRLPMCRSRLEPSRRRRSTTAIRRAFSAL